jgi:hypothetical protein
MRAFMSVVHGAVGGLGRGHEEVFDLGYFLYDIEWYNCEHTFGDPERVSSDLHELVPDYEVE